MDWTQNNWFDLKDPEDEDTGSVPLLNRFKNSTFFSEQTDNITGKSLSEALILGSTNPHYDKRLFIDLPVQYMKTTSSEHFVYIFCFDIQNNLCTQHVLSL